MLAVLTSVTAGVWIGRHRHRAGVGDRGPVGGVPVAVPVLVIWPASTSAWVVV